MALLKAVGLVAVTTAASHKVSGGSESKSLKRDIGETGSAYGTGARCLGTPLVAAHNVASFEACAEEALEYGSPSYFDYKLYDSGSNKCKVFGHDVANCGVKGTGTGWEAYKVTVPAAEATPAPTPTCESEPCNSVAGEKAIQGGTPPNCCEAMTCDDVSCGPGTEKKTGVAGFTAQACCQAVPAPALSCLYDEETYLSGGQFDCTAIGSNDRESFTCDEPGTWTEVQTQATCSGAKISYALEITGGELWSQKRCEEESEAAGFSRYTYTSNSCQTTGSGGYSKHDSKGKPLCYWCSDDDSIRSGTHWPWKVYQKPR